MTVYIDIAEFIGNPILTGIQRIVREVVTHWPPTIDCAFVRYDTGSDALQTINREAVHYAVELAHGDRFDLKEALSQIDFYNRPGDRKPVSLEPGDKLLAPELFYDHKRVAFYRRAVRSGVHVHLVVPDFLVWLKPETFPIASTDPLMPFLALLLECPGRAFISRAVQRTFEERIARRPVEDSLVLDLGADGLKVERQTFDPSRKALLCLGTLDGRKGQEHVYDAFCRDPPMAGALRLVFVGRVPPNVSAKVSRLLANARPDVQLITDASDTLVADQLRHARAIVYTSPNEGYGLPPMEGLHAGLPVVVHEGLPALEGKPSDGQLRLPDDRPETIRSALERLADDQEAQMLRAGASAFKSVTWRDTVARLAAWVADGTYRSSTPVAGRRS